jgi:hypothetical protein
MKTADLLNNLIKIKDDLNSHGVVSGWLEKREILVIALNSYLLQLKYQKLKLEQNAYIKFMETGTSLSDEDRKNLKEASAVNRQVGKRLREIKKGK